MYGWNVNTLCYKLQYVLDGQVRTKEIKRNNGIKKTPYSNSNSNGNIDYEDFPEVVPFLQAISNDNLGIYKAPKKRYRKLTSSWNNEYYIVRKNDNLLKSKYKIRY